MLTRYTLSSPLPPIRQPSSLSLSSRERSFVTFRSEGPNMLLAHSKKCRTSFLRMRRRFSATCTCTTFLFTSPIDMMTGKGKKFTLTIWNAINQCSVGLIWIATSKSSKIKYAAGSTACVCNKAGRCPSEANGRRAAALSKHMCRKSFARTTNCWLTPTSARARDMTAGQQVERGKRGRESYR